MGRRLLKESGPGTSVAFYRQETPTEFPSLASQRSGVSKRARSRRRNVWPLAAKTSRMSRVGQVWLACVSMWCA